MALALTGAPDHVWPEDVDGLSTCRAVIQRSTSARRVFRRTDNLRHEAHQVLWPNDKVLREPRPTRGTSDVSPFGLQQAAQHS